MRRNLAMLESPMKRLALVAAGLLGADTVLYVTLLRLDSSRIFYDRSDISGHRLNFWLANSYDPELGWDVSAKSKNNAGSARRGDYPAGERYKIKAFGDSFTFGSDVNDNQTWEARIERVTGWSCLNYGVPGYGTDQAFLKYRRTSVKSEVTILGVQEENIARVVNIYQAFYMGEWGPPKPRFFLDGAGLRLEPNPIARPEDAPKLLDPAFVDSLRRLDYWPKYNEEVLAAPRRLHWPATWTILSHGRFFLTEGALAVRLWLRPTFQDEMRRFRPYHLYDPSSEAFQILVRIIGQFAALAVDRGEKPLVVIFPMEHTVDAMRRYNRCVYEPLVNFLDFGGIPYLDLGPVFAGAAGPAKDAGDNGSAEGVPRGYEKYYVQYNGHLSARGNERVAREIIHRIEAL